MGKSTLAAQIAEAVEGQIIHGDDFFAGGVEVRPEPAEQLAKVCIDRRAVASVLATLCTGQTARFHAFDWKRFDGRLREKETVVSPDGLIILEGVYSNHPELRPFLDLSVLIETSDDTRLQRLIAREGELTAWERQWHRAEDHYFAKLALPESFDLVIKT